MIPPTPAHAETLNAIRTLSKERGVPPTYRQLRDALGLASVSNVHRRLSRMKERGLVDFEFGRRCSIRIVGEMEGLETRTSAELRAIRTRISEILEDRGTK